MWWHTPAFTPALGRQRSESEKYKVSLCYKVSLRATWRPETLLREGKQQGGEESGEEKGKS